MLSELDHLDWPERVKTMQRNWIGRSTGARLAFKLETGDELEVHDATGHRLRRYLHGSGAGAPARRELTTDEQREEVEAYANAARYMTEIDQLSTDESKAKTGVFTGGYAINPLTDERIPVWIADYVLMTYGTGAIMAVPSGDQRDFEFARAFNLPIRLTVQPIDGDPLDPDTMTEAYHGPGVVVNSGEFNGKQVPEAIPEMITRLEELRARQGGSQLPLA
ncbi:MAG: class I tRNA ligase family protein [Thermomicrobiales bacterium]